MNLPSSLIPREAYTKRLHPFVRKPLVKVLTGQRRVGKSYLLYQLIREVLQEDPTASVIYINKEDFAFDAIREAADLHDYIQQRLVAGKWNYVLVDEIQEIASFEKAIRSLLLQKQTDVYITGSNAHLLSGELATLLSGRTIEVQVYSLSYPEFLQFHRLEAGQTSLDLYLRYGGLPYLHNLQLTDEVVFEYLRNIYTTILYRDVIARHSIRSNRQLENLVRFLADSVGSLFSANSISDYLKAQQVKLPHNQVQYFADCLASAFLVHKVPRYDIKGKRRFETGEKYYFENLGIRNALAGYRATDRGKLVENAVYNHLRYRGYTVQVGIWQGAEVDFVAEKEQEKIYVQVALRLEQASTLDREFGNLQKIGDNYSKLVVTYDLGSRNTYAGIRHLSLLEFLQEV
ncbi:MAG TPA: ATP-binding protein [Lacibacter sp.]|nr:ATP-binding protein [Lacibacter sp.]HMO89965.1 ATP-binding protein [Lacibacter sp.]